MDGKENIKYDGTANDRKKVLTVEKQFVVILLVTLFTVLFITVFEATV